MTITSHGLLAVGGLVAFALGASAFYTQPGDPLAPTVAVAWPIIAVMTGLTALVIGGLVVLRHAEPPCPAVGHGCQPHHAAARSARHARPPCAATCCPTGSVYARGRGMDGAQRRTAARWRAARRCASWAMMD